MNKFLKIFLTVIKTVFIVVILLFVSFVLFQRFSKNNKSIFGYRMFAVVTGSMEPKYQIGDVLLCKDVNTDTLKVGDDITYLGKEGSFKDKVITHRIIKIDDSKDEKIFQTKGIASSSADPPIVANQIYGKVSRKLVVLSAFHSYSTSNIGFFFFVIIPIMLLIGTEVVQTMIEKYERKNNLNTVAQEGVTDASVNNMAVQPDVAPTQSASVMQEQLQQEIVNLQQQIINQQTQQPVQQVVTQQAVQPGVVQQPVQQAVVQQPVQQVTAQQVAQQPNVVQQPAQQATQVVNSNNQ